MSERKKIVVVGGVAGGASAAARARRLCERCEITVFDKGPYVSFANCGLPYYVGDVIRDEKSLLVATPNYGTFGWRLIENTYHKWFVGEFDAESNHVTHYDPPTLREHLSGPLRLEHIGTVCMGMILVAASKKAA